MGARARMYVYMRPRVRVIVVGFVVRVRVLLLVYASAAGASDTARVGRAAPRDSGDSATQPTLEPAGHERAGFTTQTARPPGQRARRGSSAKLASAREQRTRFIGRFGPCAECAPITAGPAHQRGCGPPSRCRCAAETNRTCGGDHEIETPSSSSGPPTGSHSRPGSGWLRTGVGRDWRPIGAGDGGSGGGGGMSSTGGGGRRLVFGAVWWVGAGPCDARWGRTS